MASLQYPGYAVPQPTKTTVRDLLDLWDRGVEQGKADRYEREAPDAFAAYVDSIYGGRPATPAPGSGAQTAGLVGGSHDAAAAAEDPMLAAYFKATKRSESAGNPNAKNPNSSALGLYQFLEPTWKGLMESHPELGLTTDGRSDPVQQEKAIRAFTADNARTLKANGLSVDPGALYAAHFLGAGGASKVLQGDPNSPVSAYVSPEVISANPQLGGMTVGQFREWAASKGGNPAGGYAAPTANVASSAPAAGGGLPARQVMLDLFRNPLTRPLAIDALKTAQAASATGKPTDDISEYLFAVRQGHKGSFADWQKTKAGPQTVINNSTGATSKFYDELDSKLAGQVAGSIEAGASARANAVRLGELERLLESVPQGATGGMVQLAGALGIGFEGAGDVQAAQAIINQMVPQQRPPGSGTMSDADLALFKASLPAILNQPDGNQQIMTMIKAINQYTIDQADIAQMVANREIDPAEGRRRQAAVPNPLADLGRTKKDGRGDEEAYPEGTVIQNDAGEKMVMKNGQWVDFNG